MEYIDTGVSQQAIGIPSEEEKKCLAESGYILMSKGKQMVEPYEEYEIWLKA